MVPLEAPYPGVYIDTFIFFLRSLCKIIWMNVHYFPNAPRTLTPYAKVLDSLVDLTSFESYTYLGKMKYWGMFETQKVRRQVQERMVST